MMGFNIVTGVLGFAAKGHNHPTAFPTTHRSARRVSVQPGTALPLMYWILFQNRNEPPTRFNRRALHSKFESVFSR